MNKAVRALHHPRRKRPALPDIERGTTVLLERPECGKNVYHLKVDGEMQTRVVTESASYSKLALKPARSKYTPHVGKKQANKRAWAARKEAVA